MFIAVPPNTEREPLIDCGAFFPAIDPKTARLDMRLDGTVTPARLRAALVEGAGSAIDELRDWSIGKQSAGYATLADVPAPVVDHVSLYVSRFHRAVHSFAAACLTETLRQYDSTDAGHQEADKLTPTIEEYRRNARWAISDITGGGRTTVELI